MTHRHYVGAHEHREAAIAVYQAGRHRCLAVLVSSYFILRLKDTQPVVMRLT